MVAVITDQVRAMHDGAFGDDEVDRARRYLAGACVFDFQTVEQRADRLLELERLGLGLDEPALARADRPDHPRPGPPGRAGPPRPEALFRVEYGPVCRETIKARQGTGLTAVILLMPMP